MSCYFQVMVKNKYEEDSKSILLESLCTTPARSLNEDFHFEFDKETPFTKELCKNIINYYKNLNQKHKKNKMESNQQIKEIKKNLYKCTSMEVFRALQEDINGNQEMLEYYNEQILLNQLLINEFNVLLNIMDLNNYEGGSEVKEFYYIYG